MRTLPILLLTLAALLPAAAETANIVSAPATAPVAGAGGSYVGSFSPDGRFLLFFSHANNLVTNDGTAPFLDVFARNLSNGMVTLVSVATNGRGGGDENSPFATMSTNGLVAFESRAGNLTTNDTNGLSDVFVRDLLAGTTTLVSVNSNGTRSAEGRSTTPLLSQDGRRVIFESTATNLVAGDTNRFPDVFARDLIAGTTVRASRFATNAGPTLGPSESPSISADGRYVAFAKRAVNTIGSTHSSEAEIYVRDLDAGTTTWASVNARTNFAATVGYPYRCYGPVLSADGRYVAFFAEGWPAAPLPSFAGPMLFRHDLVSGVTERLALSVTNVFGIPMSADGRVLAWISTYGSGITATGLYLWDEASGTSIGLSAGRFSATAPVLSADGNRLAWFTNYFPGSIPDFIGLRIFDRVTGSNQLVNPATTNGASALPTEPSVPALSPDGRFVAFETDDARLAPGDENDASDVFIHDLDTGTTQLASAASPTLPPASATGMASLAPGALSADGRFLAFSALDGNLFPGDTNRHADVFVRDLLAGGLIAASAGVAPGPGGLVLNFHTNEANTAPVMSGDGRVVVFRRWKPGSASVNKLLWRDLSSNQPVIVFGQNEVSPTNTIAVNHDGRLIAFDSQTSANSLGFTSGPDANGTFDVFVRDMVARTNGLISVNRDGTGTGNGASFLPVMSPDGQWLAFLSRATDLTTNAAWTGLNNAFVRHLPSGRTRLLSETNLLAGFPSYGLRFSADSHHVVFGVRQANVFTNIYRHDLLAATTVRVCGGCQNPSVSGDGRFVAYVNQGRTVPFGSVTWQVAVKDIATGVESLISVGTNGLGPAYQVYFGPAPTAQISRDGRYVLFSSLAADVLPTDTNYFADLFARDRVARRTYHLTVNTAGTLSANGLSSVLLMSGDSRTAVFQSHADDLAPGDYNHRRDVFTVRLAEPDGDHDGMDDDWEMAYFSTLDRDGAGDFDGDGASDRREFEAHTDPTNTGSIFRVITLAQEGGGYRLYWNAEPGRTYLPQFRFGDVREDGWVNFSSSVLATADVASAFAGPVTPASNRFYRVLLLE